MSQNTAAVVAIATPKPSQSPVSMTQRIMALVFGRIHHPHVLQTVVAVAVSAKILLIFNLKKLGHIAAKFSELNF